MWSLFSSTASEMALRATFFLALQPPGKLSTIRDIARRTGLPEPYLAKIMRRLTSIGLVRAFRGPGGGVELGRAPRSITLGAIVRAVEGLPHARSCVLGARSCTAQNPCPLHKQWDPLRAEIQRMLEETTLDTLARSLPKKTRPRFPRVRARRPARPTERQKRNHDRAIHDATPVR